MLQSLVITLREGIEATLVIGIVLGYLRKTGRQSWKRLVYWALSLALAASAVAAYFLHKLQVAEESYEGWLLIVGAVFVASMIFWVWRTGKRMRKEIETKLSEISREPDHAAAAGLFLFVFLMVLREGIETVLFLAAVSLRTSELVDFMGGLIGLGLAVAFGIAFFKGSLKVNLRKFFTVTTAVLFVVAAQLAISGVHELSEAQILPSSQHEMAFIGPIVNKDAFFFVVIVALALFLIVAQRIHSAGARDAEAAMLPAPERRKLAAEQRRERFWKTAASAAGLAAIILISAEFIYSQTAHAMPPRELASVVGREARIPIVQLTADHNLHRYVVHVGGVDVNLIAILDSTGTVRAALDACAICGTQGYHQDGKNVVCQNCAAAIYIPTIGVAGGCNPIHIDYQVDHDTLIISTAALEQAAAVFK